jgi:oligopeptide transport system permease protein
MITLFFILTVVFLLLRLLPDEKYVNYEKVQKLKGEQKELAIQKQLEKFGLHKPIYEQLFDFYYQLAPIPKEICSKFGYKSLDSAEEICLETKTVYVNFGEPIKFKPKSTIGDIIKDRFPISFVISILSVLIAYIIGYPMGVYMAMHKGKLFDKIGNGYIIALISVPGLVFYYMIIVFQSSLKMPTIFDPAVLSTWLIPVFAIGFLSSGGTAMWVRRYMVDEMNADYVKFARSKGLSESRIMFTHVLRNALVYLARGFAATLLLAVMGSYFVENLWVIPGSGKLLIKSLQNGDLPLIQALVVVYAVLSMSAVLLGDLVTIMLDPRISLTKNK